VYYLISHVNVLTTDNTQATHRTRGPATVVCLDVSENMEGRAFQEMISTAKTIVTGSYLLQNIPNQKKNNKQTNPTTIK